MMLYNISFPELASDQYLPCQIQMCIDFLSELDFVPAAS